MQIYWTTINKIVEENSEIKTYMLDCPKDFSWEEGSYTHFALEGFNKGDKPNRNLIRHMSIMTLPYENSIGITTRIKEHCSEFKKVLKNIKVGDNVAIFKTRSNVPLKREGQNIYLLSSGVGLATFRPLVLDFLNRSDNINQVYSLNIDSSKQFIFTNIFKTTPENKFISEFVDNRKDYYEQVKNLTKDKDGYFYIVGSDEFLKQNIQALTSEGIKQEQIMLDKNERELPNFLTDYVSNS